MRDAQNERASPHPHRKEKKAPLQGRVCFRVERWGQVTESYGSDARVRVCFPNLISVGAHVFAPYLHAARLVVPNATHIPF
jgi:hypothetical protein